MNIKNHLDYLYYKINRQNDYMLQQQTKDGFMSKRRPYSEIGFNCDEYWIPRVNARTILKTELVLDYDPDGKLTKNELKLNIRHIVAKLKKFNPDSVHVYDTSSKGYHIHVFFGRWYNIPLNEKVQLRKDMACSLPMWKQNKDGTMIRLNPDMQKMSENVMINLEHSKHWKTGKQKKLIGEWYNMYDDELEDIFEDIDEDDDELEEE